MKKQILVVGGGIIGLMTARELLAAGQQVTLIDRQQLGREASWAGAGILSPLYPWEYDDAILQLALWSQEQYPKITRELMKNTAVDAEWVRSGLLVLQPFDQDAAASCCSQYPMRHDLLQNSEVRDLIPGLDYDADGFWMPDVAQVRNPRLIAALRRDLEKKGCNIIEYAGVESFVVEQGQLRGLNTSKGMISAEHCLLTAGSWTAKLLDTTGITIPIYPVRGQMLLWQTKPQLIRHMLLQEHLYLVPRSDGHVLVGSTLERVGFDKATTGDAYETLRQWACSRLPQLNDYPIIQHWAGLRPATDDSIPYIGPHPEIEGLYFCAGHFRNGLVSAPGSARLLVDLLLQREPLLDPVPFDIRQRQAGSVTAPA